MSVDEMFDVVVVGSGAGALTGAVTAASQGLSVCVLEKTESFGGTTAYSGGGVFIPNNPVILRAGVPDTEELGRAYLRRSIAGRMPESLQAAYVAAGPTMIGWLEEHGYARFRWSDGFPDYHTDDPNGMAMGRTMTPLPVEDRAGEVGAIADSIRPALVRGQGGLPRVDDPTRLTGGRALLGRLLAGCEALGVELRLDAGMTDLVLSEDGVVVGVSVGSATIGARRGVLLAAGGFERDATMRQAHQPVGAAWTLGAPGNTGEVIRAGAAAGAALDLLDDAWWTPSFVYPDGSTAFVLIERALPGGVIVDASGERYANESLPYNQFGHAMLEFGKDAPAHIPSYLIVDSRFLARYPFFGLAAGEGIPDEWLEAGVVRSAPTVEELGDALGLPAGALAKTIDRFNEAARTGVDTDFARGDLDFDRGLLDFFVRAGGLPAPEGPNPCLAPVAEGPFFAATIYPGDLGTKGGLVCDDRARVLREDGSVIRGLYATGNTAASMMGNDYPGPGSTLGPAMVFAYLAALDCAEA